jgi:hypothetical protein
VLSKSKGANRIPDYRHPGTGHQRRLDLAIPAKSRKNSLDHQLNHLMPAAIGMQFPPPQMFYH